MSISKNLLILILLSSFNIVARSQNSTMWSIKNLPIPTNWTGNVTPENVWPEYPRPSLVRKGVWMNLNGLWDYCKKDTQITAVAGDFKDKILVPFPIESSLSGVKEKLLPSQNLWYRRTFSIKNIPVSKRILLHFGAVDWKTTVFLNNVEVGQHEGGYNGFTFDITDNIKNGNNELVVKVFDPTDKGIGPHGKQVQHPGNIYYTSTSGIWQTVWVEIVPINFVEKVYITPDIDKGEVSIKVNVNRATNAKLSIEASIDGDRSYKVGIGDSLNLIIPNAHLWSPQDPYLYNLTIKVRDSLKDKTIDQVTTYFGMRKVSIQKDKNGYDRIFLNNKYVFNLGTLDQGFWPDGLYTAPNDSALAYDIKIIKAMGFNTIRKHIKIEPERWYYHADRLGMLVWQDFVNPNQGLPEGSKQEFERGIGETIDQLYNHPSIITWVVFNEKWGQFDQQRLTEKVKVLDHSRLVNGHSGELLYVNDALRSPSPNAYISSDMVDIHSYPYPKLPSAIAGKVSVLGEYGGIGVPVDGQLWDDLVMGWGYQGVGTTDTLIREYSKMIDSIQSLEKRGLSASIYTQPFDVESEQNGLLTYNRSCIKLPIDTIRSMNSKVVQIESIKSELLDFTPILVRTDNKSYSNSIKLYNDGRRDSFLLRTLAIRCDRHGETELKRKVLKDYARVIVDPVSDVNIRLFVNLSTSTKDTAFNIVQRNKAALNRLYGENAAENFLMRLIYNEEIAPKLNSDSVDWNAIEKEVVTKYGELAKERIVSSKVVYYLEKKDWVNFGKYYKEHFDKAYITGRNNLHINNMSWMVFLHINDTGVLSTAIRIMEYNIKRFDSSEANSIDTYANLLYKIGRKNEALTQAKIAMGMSNSQVFKDVYRKMIRNEKTWE